jgi:cyclase
VTPHQEIEEIVDGVWLGLPAPGEGGIGAVVGSDLILFIDTTSYPPFAERFVAAVEAAAPGRRRLLYITHRHFDHFGGAVAIDAPIMSHRLTRSTLAGYDDGWVARHVPAWLEKGMLIAELVGEPRVVLPDITFDGTATVDVGGLTVDIWLAGGHCADQTMAYVRERKLLWGSDNIFSGRAPAIDHADVATWITALERLEDLPVEIVVPGHGPLGGRELLTDQIESLRAINLDLMKEGV